MDIREKEQQSQIIDFKPLINEKGILPPTFELKPLTTNPNLILQTIIKGDDSYKTCPICSKKFLGHRKNQISCSDLCSKRNYAKLHPKQKHFLETFKYKTNHEDKQ